MATKKKPAKKKVKAKSTVKSEKKQRGKPFKSGESGNPKGRPKGAKSWKTLLVEERLEELKFDPIAVMVDLANDKKAPMAIRAKLASDLAGFVFPKRKAVELSGSIGRNDVQEMTEEELSAIINGGNP